MLRCSSPVMAESEHYDPSPKEKKVKHAKKLLNQQETHMQLKDTPSFLSTRPQRNVIDSPNAWICLSYTNFPPFIFSPSFHMENNNTQTPIYCTLSYFFWSSRLGAYLYQSQIQTKSHSKYSYFIHVCFYNCSLFFNLHRASSLRPLLFNATITRVSWRQGCQTRGV